MLGVSQGGRVCPDLNTILELSPHGTRCLPPMGTAGQELQLVLPWAGALVIEFPPLHPKLPVFANLLTLAGALLCWVWYHDSDSHGAPRTVTEEWTGGWPGCHHEDAVKQLSVLVFETRGKDGFRVLGKQQPSSAHAGQSLSYLRVTPPGEALKSNIRKVDLNIHHPEHHTFVVVPCMHVIAASLFSPPKKLAVRNGDDRTRYSCPQLCCSDAHPRSKPTVRWDRDTQHTQLAGC